MRVEAGEIQLAGDEKEDGAHRREARVTASLALGSLKQAVGVLDEAIGLAGLSLVGSRTGARTLGSGGGSTAFAVGLSPAAMATFPAPASSNAAGRFPALRSPVCFMSTFTGPIMLGTLSMLSASEPCSH